MNLFDVLAGIATGSESSVRRRPRSRYEGLEDAAGELTEVVTEVEAPAVASRQARPGPDGPPIGVAGTAPVARQADPQPPHDRPAIRSEAPSAASPAGPDDPPTELPMDRSPAPSRVLPEPGPPPPATIEHHSVRVEPAPPRLVPAASDQSVAAITVTEVSPEGQESPAPGLEEDRIAEAAPVGRLPEPPPEQPVAAVRPDPRPEPPHRVEPLPVPPPPKTPPEPVPAPVVEVTIGRIEVVASLPKPAPRPRRRLDTGPDLNDVLHELETRR